MQEHIQELQTRSNEDDIRLILDVLARANLLTPDNRQLVIDCAIAASNIILTLNCIPTSQLTQDKFQAIMDHTGDVVSMNQCLKSVNLLTRDNILLFRYSNNTKITKMVLNGLLVAELLTQDNLQRTLTPTDHQKMRLSAIGAMGKGKTLNQPSFNTIYHDPKHALFFAYANGGIGDSENVGAKEFTRLRFLATFFAQAKRIVDKYGYPAVTKLGTLPLELLINIITLAPDNHTALDSPSRDYVARTVFFARRPEKNKVKPIDAEPIEAKSLACDPK